jgi:hypothetical protein
MAGITKDIAFEAMRLAGHKLPIKTKIVEREGLDEAAADAAAKKNMKSAAQVAAEDAAAAAAAAPAAAADAEAKPEGGDVNEG